MAARPGHLVANSPGQLWLMAAQVTDMTDRYSRAFTAGLPRRIFANAALLHFWPMRARSGVITIQMITHITITMR